MRLNLIGLLLFCFAANAAAAGHLRVEHAWIRAAPPGVPMLAGYATLMNVDTVLAKHYFGAETVGRFAKAATIARIARLFQEEFRGPERFAALRQR